MTRLAFEEARTKVKISLEAVRVNAKMTQREWAKILGTTNAAVSRWEKGTEEPTLPQVRKMSELSGIPMDFIFVPDVSN